jgi:alkylated DNA repair dioxygenase AlkB
MQCALFGTGAPAFDAGLPGMQRRVLSGGAWVEHHPGWLEGHERVFEQLREQTQWQSHRRQMYEREVQVPRLVARAPEEGPLAELLSRLSATLTRRYQRSLKGMALDDISLAYYRDGNDSVALHGDKLGRLATDTIVATVSVGAPRRLLLKPNAGGPSLTFDLGWGDLFVMGGSCQRTWQHAVPKRRHADPRISIIFRPPLAER